MGPNNDDDPVVAGALSFVDMEEAVLNAPDGAAVGGKLKTGA